MDILPLCFVIRRNVVTLLKLTLGVLTIKGTILCRIDFNYK